MAKKIKKGGGKVKTLQCMNSRGGGLSARLRKKLCPKTGEKRRVQQFDLGQVRKRQKTPWMGKNNTLVGNASHLVTSAISERFLLLIVCIYIIFYQI